MHETVQLQFKDLPHFYTIPGKRSHRQQVKTTLAAGLKQGSRLFYIWDKNYEYLFLVDTGAQISAIPLDSKWNSRLSSYILQAANGFKIETYGKISLTLNLGLCRSFLWIFTQAQLKKTVLGTDFLSHFNIVVDMAMHSLIDINTEITAKGITSLYMPTGICSTIPAANGLQELIKNFQLLLLLLSIQMKFVTLLNTTTEPPTYASPRRLHPEKYKIAKDEFQHMLQLGIIHPSSNSYSSLLHMVQKPDTSARRPCEDFRKLNVKTVPDRYLIPHLHGFAISLQGTTKTGFG